MSDAHLTIYRAVKLKSNPIRAYYRPDPDETQRIVSTVHRTVFTFGPALVAGAPQIYALLNIGSAAIVPEKR